MPYIDIFAFLVSLQFLVVFLKEFKITLRMTAGRANLRSFSSFMHISTIQTFP